MPNESVQLIMIKRGLFARALFIHNYFCSRWSETECERKKLVINPDNQRHVLRDALYLMRFPLMDPEDFASKVMDSGILSEAEANSVLLDCIGKSKPQNNKFSKIPRQASLVVSRFQSIVTGGSYGGSPSIHNLG